MTRIFRLLAIYTLIAFSFTTTLMAQMPPPPPPGGGGGGIRPGPGGDPISGVPINDSVLPLIIFALIYAGIKFYYYRQLHKTE